MAKILLVEDEINIASFIERGLKEFGHSVTVCHDGDTGWKILQDEPFDLLILDIIMPKINGLELCRLYRQMFGYQIPVIMLTALGTTEDIVKGLDAGADDYNSPPCPVVGGTVCKLPSLSIPLTALTFPCCLSKTSSTSFSCPSAGGVILFAINNWNFSGYGNSPAQR